VARRRGSGFLLGATRLLLWLPILSLGVLGAIAYLVVERASEVQEKRSREISERYLAQVEKRDQPQSWRGLKRDGSPSDRLFYLYDPDGRMAKTDRRTQIAWTADLTRRYPNIPANANVKCLLHVGSNIFSLIEDCLPDEMK
jgi:hypothetical protein